MSTDALDIRMARLEGAYDQITKRLDDLHADIQQLRSEFQQFRGEIRTELQQLRTELQQFRTELQQLRTDFTTGIRSQFWQFAALMLPLWLAAAALLLRH